MAVPMDFAADDIFLCRPRAAMDYWMTGRHRMMCCLCAAILSQSVFLALAVPIDFAADAVFKVESRATEGESDQRGIVADPEAAVSWTTIPGKGLNCTPFEYKGSVGNPSNAQDCPALARAKRGINYAVWFGNGDPFDPPSPSTGNLSCHSTAKWKQTSIVAFRRQMMEIHWDFRMLSVRMVSAHF